VFGTTVAGMRIVSVAELIGESLNGETWLCGEVRFSLGRGIIFHPISAEPKDKKPVGTKAGEELDGKYFSERQVSGHEADLRNLQS